MPINNEIIKKAFSKTGFEVDIINHEKTRRWRSLPFNLNVEGKIGDQSFKLELNPDCELQIIDQKPKDKSMLLLFTEHQQQKSPIKTKMLIGHDERQLFVAAVPSNVKSVEEAKDHLKPKDIVEAERKVGVKSSKKNKHRNKARIRQGDFFFLPVTIDFDESLIIRNEPINRNRGRSHIVQYVVRQGGKIMYQKGMRTITPEQYNNLPPRSKTGWRQVALEASVFAKGKVTHPEHSTVILKSWHRIIPNTESDAKDSRGDFILQSMSFVD